MENEIITNTNLVVFNREGHMRTMQELVPLYTKHGYKKLDLNFCEMMNPSSLLKTKESAKPYLESLKHNKQSLGVTYVQCHLPYATRGENPYKTDNIKLALEYAEELNIPIAVIHPIKASLEENLKYFETLKSYVPKGVTLAIENMETEEEISKIEELLMLTSSLSYKTGICLDTGHANILNLDISSFIERAGDKLIATHIADNDGHRDQHLLPGFGTIAWEKIIPAFKKHYNGYLNYEAMFFSRHVTEKAIPEIISLSKAIGLWLLGL